MFYNNIDKILIPRVPTNLIKPDGSIFINFNLSSVNILADYGFYTVRNDNDKPKENCIEDESQRQIILDKPYADIIRSWIDNSDA